MTHVDLQGILDEAFFEVFFFPSYHVINTHIDDSALKNPQLLYLKLYSIHFRPWNPHIVYLVCMCV